MKNIILSLFDFTNDFIDTLLSIVKILIRSRRPNKIKQLLPQGSGLAILANGPSLKESLVKDRDFIRKQKKLVVNAFALSAEYEEFRPEYYVIADPGLWIKNALPQAEELRAKIAEAVTEKTSWEMVFFVPFEARGNNILMDSIGRNKNISICFYNKTTVKGFRLFRNWIYKLSLGMPRPQNVLIPSLMLALNMDYKNIYIFGGDHSWHESLYVNENNELCIIDHHFYDHSAPKYHVIKNYKTGANLKIHEQFEALSTAFRLYHIIKEYSDFLNSNIYNFSYKSYIDAFPKKKL